MRVTARSARACHLMSVPPGHPITNSHLLRYLSAPENALRWQSRLRLALPHDFGYRVCCLSRTCYRARGFDRSFAHPDHGPLLRVVGDELEGQLGGLAKYVVALSQVMLGFEASVLGSELPEFVLGGGESSVTWQSVIRRAHRVVIELRLRSDDFHE